MKNLIKRKSLDYKIKDGWYCEVAINRKPSGSTCKVDEEIFIAQNGYAVFAKGVISEKKEKICNNLGDLVRFSQIESSVDDSDFWISKFKEYSKKKEPFLVHVFEYRISNTELFETCIPLQKRFLNQSAWYRLEDEFILEFPEKNQILTKHIPTKMREEIYHLFKINRKEFIVDIDHFIPSSLGGPGNIIENLIPLSASINRRKGDRVPSKLFDLGKKFNVQVPLGLAINHDLFYGSVNEKSLAKKIIEKINQQSIEEIKFDYKSIRDFHFPSLKEI